MHKNTEALEKRVVKLNEIIEKLTSPNYDDSLSADVIEYEGYNQYYEIYGIYCEEKTANVAYKNAIKEGINYT